MRKTPTPRATAAAKEAEKARQEQLACSLKENLRRRKSQPRKKK